MLTENRIFVDTEPINKAKQRLVVGQKVTIKPQKSQTKKSQEAKQRLTKFELIYEDQQILAVSKPANLLSIATDKLETETLHCTRVCKNLMNMGVKKNNRLTAHHKSKHYHIVYK